MTDQTFLPYLTSHFLWERFWNISSTFSSPPSPHQCVLKSAPLPASCDRDFKTTKYQLGHHSLLYVSPPLPFALLRFPCYCSYLIPFKPVKLQWPKQKLGWFTVCRPTLFLPPTEADDIRGTNFSPTLKGRSLTQCPLGNSYACRKVVTKECEAHARCHPWHWLPRKEGVKLMSTYPETHSIDSTDHKFVIQI